MKKRKDGRYAKQIVVGHSDDGKKITKSVYGSTKAETERKAAQIRADYALGFNVAADQTFKHWAELYLKSPQCTKLNQHAYTVKKARIEAFFPSIGKMSLKDIVPAHIEAYLGILAKDNPCTHKPTSEKTLKEYKNAAGQVFKYAIKNKSVAFNPCEYAELPDAEKKKERRALSTEERMRLDCLTGDCRLPMMIACYGGLRRGELTALTWDDIDLKAKTISVNKAWDFKKQKEKLPKTSAGVRAVPICEKLYNELKSVKHKKGLVCTWEGKRLTDSTWAHLTADALVQIDNVYGTPIKDIKVGSKYERIISIQPFGMHDLRHTFCSLCYSAGVDILSCKEILGHSDVQTTMAIYTHLSQGKKTQSIEKLNAFLNCGQSTDSQAKSQTLDI